MGQTKQLLPLGNKPVISHCAETLLVAGIHEIVAVVGTQRTDIVEALRDLPVIIKVNDKAGSDMAESARHGLQYLSPFSAVLISLSDHPLVTSETVRSILREHQSCPAVIIVPEYDGRRGHPALFPRPVIEELRFGVTLRDIVRKDPTRVKPLTVRDEGIILDMDTPDDYSGILARFRATK